MKKIQFLNSVAVLLLLVVSFGAARLDAQFDISWYTIDGGGGYSAGGSFELEGTIGQHDAGPVMTGGSFSLAGGFWAGGEATGGSNETVADSFTAFRGFYLSGELEDTFASDDAYLKYNPGIILFPNEAPVWLIFDGFLPSDNPSSLSVTLEASADTVGLSQTMEMFNWNSGLYEEIDVRAPSLNSDSVVTIDVTASIADYVEPGTGAVRSRFGWRKTGIIFLFPWTICGDQVVWISQ